MNWRLVFGLAFRNLFRNKRRNAISSVAIIAGVFALIMGNGLIDGLDEITIKSQEDVLGGHVLIRPTDFPTDGRNYPLDKTLIPSPQLLEQLENTEIKAWTKRLWFRARLIREADSTRIKVVSYQPDQEPVVFPRDKWSVEGSWPAKPDELAIGKKTGS